MFFLQSLIYIFWWLQERFIYLFLLLWKQFSFGSMILGVCVFMWYSCQQLSYMFLIFLAAVSGSVEHGNYYAVKLVYEHILERTSHSMTYGAFGGVKGFLLFLFSISHINPRISHTCPQISLQNLWVQLICLLENILKTLSLELLLGAKCLDFNPNVLALCKWI